MTSYYYVGGIFPDEMEEYIIENSKGYVQSAANNFQLKLIEGLLENLNNKSETSFEILNAPFVGSYPFLYKKMHLPEIPYKVEGYDGVSIPYNNLILYKNISKAKNIKKILERKLKQDKSPDIKIIIYSVHSPFLTVISQLKKKFQFKTCLIVPDLPEFMNLGRKESQIKKTLKKIDKKIINSTLKDVDSYILFSKYMIEKLPYKPFKVIEGISKNMYPSKIDKKNEIILYTGTLDRKYGIMNFIKNFLKIESGKLKLRIYGYGDTIKEIENIQKKYPNKIDYRGVAKNSIILREQMSAKFLVNPRPSDENYTKYSFPSKNMEYLSSGVPVIATKLKGIPEEYSPFLNFLTEKSDYDYQKSLQIIINEDYGKLLIKANEARLFLQKEKNSLVQTKKILDILD